VTIEHPQEEPEGRITSPDDLAAPAEGHADASYIVALVRSAFSDFGERATGSASVDMPRVYAPGPWRFMARWHGSEPWRALEVVVDPIAGTVTRAFHQAGAVTVRETVLLRAFVAADIERTLARLADDNVWRDGSLAIREDRAQPTLTD
jgi:hypothetical protein